MEVYSDTMIVTSGLVRFDRLSFTVCGNRKIYTCYLVLGSSKPQLSASGR